MSTKATIAYGDGFHLFQEWEVIETGFIRLRLDKEPVFECEPSHVTVRIPAAIQQLRSDRVIVDGDRIHLDSLRIEVVGWNCMPLFDEPTEIAIAHSPPAGMATASTAYDPVDLGDPALRETLEVSRNAPWLVLSGHNHYPRRWYASMPRSGTDQIWSLVTGCQLKSDYPAHVIIDTTVRRAERVRGSMTEVVILSR